VNRLAGADQRQLFEREGGSAEGSAVRSPLVVSNGVGVNSLAMLVGYRQRGIRPDRILFADTGSEKRRTYAYKALVLDPWLAAVGFPPCRTVRYVVRRPRNGAYSTLEEELLVNRTLAAIGRRSCSAKWKIGPQRRDIRLWPDAVEAWEQGLPVRNAIGFDAGPRERRRTMRVVPDPHYAYEFPLIEWGLDRHGCAELIRSDDQLAAIASAAGMDPVPPKSACWFCAAQKPEDLDVLLEEEPDKRERILRLEANAAHRLVTIGGIWRSATRSRPASVTEYLTGEPLLTGCTGCAARCPSESGTSALLQDQAA
jgi:hypothetical protein